MLKALIKYLAIFLISVAVVYQYQGYIAKLRLIPVGIIKLIFPEKRVEPIIDKNIPEDKLTSKILSANSFKVYVDEVDYFAPIIIYLSFLFSFGILSFKKFIKY